MRGFFGMGRGAGRKGEGGGEEGRGGGGRGRGHEGVDLDTVCIRFCGSTDPPYSSVP
jgi:hypothetical protein